MSFQFVKVNLRKITPDTLPCSKSYYDSFIKGKKLKIVHSTPSHYIRVQDENEEEWGLFPGQYKIITGLASPEPQPQTEKKKKVLPAGKT